MTERATAEETPDYAVAPDVVSAVLPDGVVVLHMGTKRYYSLNETGALVWQLLEAGSARGAIVEALRAAFAVDAPTAAAAVDRLVGELAAEQLLRPPARAAAS